MNERDGFRLRNVDINHPGMQFTLQLVSEHNGEVRCLGTAFMVAPGLAITAAHVVDDFLEKNNHSKRTEAVRSLTSIQLFQGKVLHWQVDGIYGSVAFDVAFLRFLRPAWWGDGPGQVKPRCARLNFNPPAVGDELRMFGFPESEVRDRALHFSPSESTCRVARVDLQTDLPPGFRPVSHIDVEGDLRAGMSGGPCFDAEWNVIGVNSKGWDGQQLAHVALLWAAMKIPIDLFKSGEFPAVELFKDGPARAIGYRRLHVTSKGEARLAKIDPDSLVPLQHFGPTESLDSALNFAASNARDCLLELRLSLERTIGRTEPLDTNRVIRCVRHYFWELETTLKLRLLLAARQAGIGVTEPPTWEQLVTEWRKHTADPEILDELATLTFSWDGIDLFEVRTYAELSRSGVLATSASVSVETKQVLPASLEPPCRKGGQQIFLPDGLDRFMESSKNFVQRLLRLSLVEKQKSEKSKR
jgi:trypsin-like peptidase